MTIPQETAAEIAQTEIIPPQDQVDLALQVQSYPRAQDLGLVICHCCGLLNPTPAIDPETEAPVPSKCSRCRSKLHQRKPRSLDRTLALVIAASILYIPANLLPMTVTNSLFGTQKDTILTGVIYFWQSGDYLVASIIFTASIFIPMLKLLILFFLLLAVHMQSAQRWQFSPERCAMLYRIVEMVGKWSMIDIFVVSLLTALIQLQSLATIFAGPGAMAFGAVVVLTILASLSFDPRIIWDNYYAALNKAQKKPAAAAHSTVIDATYTQRHNNSSNLSQ